MYKTIKDYDYKDKKVIIRCDLNVPMNNQQITDETRIKESLQSINYLIEHNAKTIILSHLGKISSQEDKEKNTLYPIYLKLKEYLKTNVYFSKETRGSNLLKLVNNLKNKEVLLVENTRYEDIPNKLESNCDLELSSYWANLADIFINDAYGTIHRNHASNLGLAKKLPSAIGFLIEKEITKIDNFINDASHPFTLIMGGKKISDKTLLIDALIDKCDYLILGGGMCNTFLKAKGINMGLSITDDENIPYCKELLKKYPQKILLPFDIVTKNKEIKKVTAIASSDIAYDIGTDSIAYFKKIVSSSKKILFNGPLGVFEIPPFDKGTKEILETIKENNIKTLVGGGDSASAVNILGYHDYIYHISTGGGATLEYLSGKTPEALSSISKKN